MAAERSRPRKRGRGGVRAFRIELKGTGKISAEQVEEAIERKLASTKTDVFGNSDAVVIVIEKHGN